MFSYLRLTQNMHRLFKSKLTIAYEKLTKSVIRLLSLSTENKFNEHNICVIYS